MSICIVIRITVTASSTVAIIKDNSCWSAPQV